MEWDCDRNREHQPFLTELIQNFVQDGIGVEIGVNEGQLSYHLLKNTAIRHLYLIDPWITWKGWSSQGVLDKRYDFCNVELRKIFPNRVTTIRKPSQEADTDIPNNLDFVFIDGNHGYEYVKKDLELWVPKVKSGGLVAGHDWSHSYPGLVTAVREYCSSHDVFLSYITDYSKFNLKLRYQPAPAIDPVVNKSSHSKLWWTIRK